MHILYANVYRIVSPSTQLLDAPCHANIMNVHMRIDRIVRRSQKLSYPFNEIILT